MEGVPRNTQVEFMREPARIFFAQLADAATLLPDTNGFLALPVHPSLGASGGNRFEVAPLNGRDVVHLLSRDVAQKYMGAMLGRCEEVLHNYLYIHGAAGAGKSYALYEAVCRLMARRESVRVAYVHDCAGWSKDATIARKEMAAIVATAFDPDTEPTIWDACSQTVSADDLDDLLSVTVPSYCARRNLKFLFVFDQHNGLLPAQREQFPWCLPETSLLAFNTWKRLGATVISASANNDYFLKIATYGNMKRVDCYSGFNDDEADRWRRHYNFFLGEADVWAEAKELLSNWPLELNLLRQRLEPTLAERLAAFTKDRLRILGLHEASHRRARLQEASDKEAYAGIILDMLLARPDVDARYPTVDVVTNKQLVFFDDQTTLLRPIHELVRRFYLTQGYLRPGGLLNATVKDILSNEAATSDSKGRTVESYVICCMEETATFVLEAQPYNGARRGLASAETVFEARALVRYNFGSQHVPGGIRWSQNLLLVPLNPNYPGVDVLLWDAISCVLVGVQFTVGKRSHPMTFTSQMQDAWVAASGAKTFRFVWATPSVDSTSIERGQYLVTLDALRVLCAPLLAHYIP